MANDKRAHLGPHLFKNKETAVCVRQDTQGRVWTMNQRHKGWRSHGFAYTGWEALYYSYPRAVVVGVGSDEHGPYVLMRNVGEL